ncbi:hypothetical protein NC651_033050 [Populus alba x Populus x berolinensis]|nr:hypothetical protein NC651_033050 [Populus alba x Populus x berolinensis]
MDSLASCPLTPPPSQLQSTSLPSPLMTTNARGKRKASQLCPIDPGIANGQEMEQLKKIDGVFIAF